MELEPDRYEAALQASRSKGEPLEQTESRFLGLNHCEVLEAALKHWGFSLEFIIPVVNHHAEARRLNRLHQRQRDAAATVALADRLAHALLLGDSGNDLIRPIDELLGILSLPPAEVASIARSAPAEAQALKVSMLARADRPTWGDQGSNVRARLGRPIRPLMSGSSPDIDPCLLFFQGLAASGSAESPNIGVVSDGGMPTQAGFGEALLSFEAAERELGLVDLPVLFIRRKGETGKEDGDSRRRHQCTLHLPLSVSRVADAVHYLLGDAD